MNCCLYEGVTLKDALKKRFQINKPKKLRTTSHKKTMAIPKLTQHSEVAKMINRYQSSISQYATLTNVLSTARHSRFSRFIFLLVISVVLSGCLPASQTGTSYSRDEVRRVQNIQLGTVIDLTAVRIEGTNSGVGGAVGGAVGGIAGSTVDDGAAGDIAAIVAGAAGALVGAKLENAATNANGFEYTIQLESSGEVISVVQAVDPKADQIVAGDRVKLLSQGGTYRVTRLNNPVPVDVSR